MNVNALIEMAWSDEATFSDIEREFGIKEPEVKRIMQKNLKPGSYRLWRKRVRWSQLTKNHLHTGNTFVFEIFSFDTAPVSEL